MDKKDYIYLFECMHPGFFQKGQIRNMSGEEVFAEMILFLDAFDPGAYEKEFDASVSFGYFQGNRNELMESIRKVIPEWTELFHEGDRVYCSYVDGKIASFCLVEDMGVHNINGHMLKVGGPGCVGTVPAFRNKGLGLIMVRNVTQILKEEGYDYSYIHYTGVPDWYAKLGYEITFQWNKNGQIPILSQG